MPRRSRLAGLAVLVCSCASPVPSDPPRAYPSPTRAARVAGGYELADGYVRAVVSDRTGDVTFFGPDASLNLAPAGIAARATGSADVTPVGTVEPRDEQTWQFYGTDADGVTWRKIYCLENDALLVSLIVTNNRPTTRPVTVEVRGRLHGLQTRQHDPEHLLAASPAWTVDLRGYDEFPAPDERLPPGVLLRSDHFTLKPGERQGYTTRWLLLQTK